MRSALREAESVLFLCSGNIMRSAFAELFARHLGCPLPVRSGATRFENESLHPATLAALQRRGVDPALARGFRPTWPGDLRFPRGQLVFGMTAEHLSGVPHHRRREAFLVTELVGRAAPIADPIADSDPEPVFEAVAQCVRSLVSELQRGSRAP